MGGNPINYFDPHGLCACSSGKNTVQVHIGGANWYSHAAVNINGTVYSNGRYPVPGKSNSSFGTVGPNVLVVRSNAGYLAAHKSTATFQLNLSNSQVNSLRNYYQNLINSSTKHPSRSNWYVLPSSYKFLGNNCASTVNSGLKNALPWYQSQSLPGISTPHGLQLNLSINPLIGACKCN